MWEPYYAEVAREAVTEGVKAPGPAGAPAGGFPVRAGGGGRRSRLRARAAAEAEAGEKVEAFLALPETKLWLPEFTWEFE